MSELPTHVKTMGGFYAPFYKNHDISPRFSHIKYLICFDLCIDIIQEYLYIHSCNVNNLELEMELIARKIEEIGGRIVVFSAFKMKGRGYKIKITGHLNGTRRIDHVRKFRAEVEQLINN